MDMVTLPNGTDEARVLVAGITLSLTSMLGETPLVFYDLVMMCRDRNYEAFGDNIKVIKLAGMLDIATGRPHDSVVNVVDAIVKGEELDMRIVPLGSE